MQGNGKTKIAVVGDSFASTAFHYILRAFTRYRIAHMKLIAMEGCHMVLGLSTPAKPHCDILTETIVNITREFKPHITFINFK